MRDFEKGCGRTTGHGESCSKGWLCSSCGDAFVLQQSINDSYSYGINIDEVSACSIATIMDKCVTLEAENKKLKESMQELREWLKKRMVNYSQTNLGKCTDRVYIGQVLDKLGTFDSDS